MSGITQPRLAHFSPDPSEYTQRLVLGPKFLASMFRSNPDDDAAPNQRFARALLDWMRNEEIAYKRLLINQHVLDEAATHLKKHNVPAAAFECVETVRSSELFVICETDAEAFAESCRTFCEYDDHDGAMTDFITKTFLERSETPYLATWDDHYQPFSDLNLVPRCDYR